MFIEQLLQPIFQHPIIFYYFHFFFHLNWRYCWRWHCFHIFTILQLLRSVLLLVFFSVLSCFHTILHNASTLHHFKANHTLNSNVNCVKSESEASATQVLLFFSHSSVNAMQWNGFNRNIVFSIHEVFWKVKCFAPVFHPFSIYWEQKTKERKNEMVVESMSWKYVDKWIWIKTSSNLLYNVVRPVLCYCVRIVLCYFSVGDLSRNNTKIILFKKLENLLFSLNPYEFYSVCLLFFVRLFVRSFVSVSLDCLG